MACHVTIPNGQPRHRDPPASGHMGFFFLPASLSFSLFPYGLRPSPPPKTRPWRTRSWAVAAGGQRLLWKVNDDVLVRAFNSGLVAPRPLLPGPSGSSRGDQNSAWLAASHDGTRQSTPEGGSAASLKAPMASRAESH
jgi:hypothetical protein